MGAGTRLGDFTMTRRDLRLVALAVPIGVLGAVLALVLLDLIGFITGVIFFGEVGTSIPPLTDHRIGLWAIVVPVLGGLAMGVMARFGSEQIRGHGIPEAMESILVRGSRVPPRLAVLKPTSSAISIGTGGPFGAEGPIIMTGGAAGSLVAQLFHFAAAERRVLLVAGAAAGMAGVFGTPLAATLLAVELLLFEWRPRSMVPAAVASVVAMAVRTMFADAGLLNPTPLFPVPAHAPLAGTALLGALAVGAAGGLLALVVTAAVYGTEDAFGRLPIHWLWWPAIAGIVVGIGGVIDRRALGVGYDTIGDQFAGRLGLAALVSVLLVKLVIWSVALGSGTSGGVLAPLVIIGAAAGGLMAPLLPGGSPGVWCLVGATAALAGTMRVPLTAVVFAVEITHDVNALTALVLASAAAYLISVQLSRRSILTEKIARRGVHVVQEYAVDPLEAVLVREVMDTDVVTLRADGPLAAAEELARDGSRGSQHLFPVTEDDGAMVGVVSRSELRVDGAAAGALVRERMRCDPVVAHPGETLRALVDRMLAHGIDILPVVDERDRAPVLGMVGQLQLSAARERLRDEESTRGRVLRLRRPGGRAAH